VFPEAKRMSLCIVISVIPTLLICQYYQPRIEEELYANRDTD
jgi:hypothetical protein